MIHFREIGVIILFIVLLTGFIPCTPAKTPTIINTFSLPGNNLSTLPGLNMNTLEGPQPYHEANIINRDSSGNGPTKPDLRTKFNRSSTEGLI